MNVAFEQDFAHIMRTQAAHEHRGVRLYQALIKHNIEAFVQGTLPNTMRVCVQANAQAWQVLMADFLIQPHHTPFVHELGASFARYLAHLYAQKSMLVADLPAFLPDLARFEVDKLWVECLPDLPDVPIYGDVCVNATLQHAHYAYDVMNIGVSVSPTPSDCFVLSYRQDKAPFKVVRLPASAMGCALVEYLKNGVYFDHQDALLMAFFDELGVDGAPLMDFGKGYLDGLLDQGALIERAGIV